MKKSRNEATRKEATVELPGELTVQEAARLKSLLSDGLERADCIEVDLSHTGKADIAGLQLLCAAYKTAIARGKTIVIPAVPDCVRTAAIAAGFWRPEGCVACQEEGCPWAQGGRDG
jgi:ABC-type transporter Mla MlaB component